MNDFTHIIMYIAFILWQQNLHMATAIFAETSDSV
jgi:hypothetical protein